MTGTLTVGIVGSHDRQLEELVEAAGLRPAPLRLEELTSLAQPGSSQPAVVILDLRERPVLPPIVAALRRQHPTTGVIIVAATLEPALMLEAMRAGVTELVTAPLAAPEVHAALARMTSPTAPTAAGQVFALLGAKGGVGTTTIAVNVATSLAMIEPGATILIDLHLAYGDAAIFLGTEPRYSVIDALENVHRLDKSFLRGLVGQTRGGLSFLGSSDRSSSRPVDPATVRTLIEAAAKHYRYVVLDVPRSDNVMLDVLEPASRIVIVANQELATVRAATRVAATLRQRYGKGSGVGGREPLRQARRYRRRRCREGVGEPRVAHVSEQLPAGARRVERRSTGRARQPQQAVGRADRLRAKPDRRAG